MFQLVIYWHFLVVDGERSRLDTALVLLSWMGTELARKHIENLFAHPTTFGERGESEVVRVHFSEACKGLG